MVLPTPALKLAKMASQAASGTPAGWRTAFSELQSTGAEGAATPTLTSTESEDPVAMKLSVIESETPSYCGGPKEISPNISTEAERKVVPGRSAGRWPSPC